MSPLYMGTPFYYRGRPSNTPVIASSSVLCHVPASPHREGSRRLPDHWPDAQESSWSVEKKIPFARRSYELKRKKTRIGPNSFIKVPFASQLHSSRLIRTCQQASALLSRALGEELAARLVHTASKNFFRRLYISTW